MPQRKLAEASLTCGAHGRGGRILLVVQVQDEDDFQGFGQLWINLVPLAGYCRQAGKKAGGRQAQAQRFGSMQRFCLHHLCWLGHTHNSLGNIRPPANIMCRKFSEKLRSLRG